jgi:hypothetical protein
MPIEIEYISEDGNILSPWAVAWVRAVALEKA